VKSHVCDVVVVGAGLAGLYAARRLAAAGVDVIVVEAQERVGGRTWTEHLDGDAFIDHGGQWVSPGQDRILALAEELGVSLFPSWGEGAAVDWFEGARSTYQGMFPPSAPEAEPAARKAAQSLRGWPRACRSMRPGPPARPPPGTATPCRAGSRPTSPRIAPAPPSPGPSKGCSRACRSTPRCSPPCSASIRAMPSYRRLAPAGLAARRAAVLADFVRYLGPEAGAPLAYRDTSWDDDEFARGAYGGYLSPGVWTAYGAALRAPIGSLHWAGRRDLGRLERQDGGGPALSRACRARVLEGLG
jgi:Flavin containing amine oxidoreductase